MSPPRIVLEVPDLATDRLRLRPWRVTDADALSAAWHDPEVIAGSEPPPDRTPQAAARWIAGWDERRRAGVALDLVIAGPVDDEVRGEVGLWGFDAARRAALIGWWVGADHRGLGLATDAVSLLTRWMLDTGPLETLLAEIGRDNPASERVAVRSGYRRSTPRNPQEPARGRDTRVWYVADSTVK